MLPKLNIGAGKRTFPDYINADFHPGPGIDVVFDACKPWPFADNSLGLVFGNHMLEHLPDPQAFFKEAWRCLVPGGHMEMALPYGASREAWGDPTHLRAYVPLSFCFLQPGWDEECRNPQHDAWPAPFGVVSCMLQVNEELRWMVKPIIRRIGIRILPYLWDGYNGMLVDLVALKTPEAQQAWRKDHFPQVVQSVKDYMYRHHYEGRELRPGEKKSFVFFAERNEF